MFPPLPFSRRLFLSLGPALGAAAVTNTATAGRGTAPGLDFFVHASNPTRRLDIAEIRSLYLGDREYWSNDRRIALVVWESDTDAQSAFLEGVMKMSKQQWRNHWIQRRYSGRAITMPFVVASLEAATHYLERSEGAIAFSTGGDTLPGTLVHSWRAP